MKQQVEDPRYDAFMADLLGLLEKHGYEFVVICLKEFSTLLHVGGVAQGEDATERMYWLLHAVDLFTDRMAEFMVKEASKRN